MPRQYTAEEVIKIITDYRDSLDDNAQEWYCSQKDLFDDHISSIKALFNPTPVFKRGDKVEVYNGEKDRWEQGEYFMYCVETNEHLAITEDGISTNVIRKPQN